MWVQKNSIKWKQIIDKIGENLTKPILDAKSTLTSQWPTQLDTPHVVTFWAAQWTADDDVQLLADWTLKFNKWGSYMLRLRWEFWRENSWSTSIILIRTTFNWVQIWETTAVKMMNRNILVALDSYVPAPTPQWEVKLEIMRDSSWANDWLFYSTPSSVSGWLDSPCASIQVFNLNQY